LLSERTVSDWGYESPTLNENIVFAEAGGSSSYEEVADMDRFVLTMKNFLHDYNTNSR
jgi:hypothetical protein